jgi:hypothetical protein
MQSSCSVRLMCQSKPAPLSRARSRSRRRSRSAVRRHTVNFRVRHTATVNCQVLWAFDEARNYPPASRGRRIIFLNCSFAFLFTKSRPTLRFSGSPTQEGIKAPHRRVRTPLGVRCFIAQDSTSAHQPVARHTRPSQVLRMRTTRQAVSLAEFEIPSAGRVLSAVNRRP